MPNSRSNPAALLSPTLASYAREIGSAIRKREVAALVGAGLSIPRGFPGWTELVDRLILAWYELDRSPARQRLSAENYIRLIRKTFGTDLAIVAFLNHRVVEAQKKERRKREVLSFKEYLYNALYSKSRQLFTPEPSDMHRHLVLLFRDYPGRIWTTNYDDLLERASELLDISADWVDPTRYRTKADLVVAHLHGYLAPPGRLQPSLVINEVRVSLALAEDDYFIMASDATGWANREFYRLFDENRVLILGMSLNDPNVRRVLTTILEQSKGSNPCHFAVTKELSIEQKDLPKTRSETQRISTEAMNTYNAKHWGHYGVKLVGLPDHDWTLPFLMRLRYETYGGEPGRLWDKGHKLGYAAVNPWGSSQQEKAKSILSDGLFRLKSYFSVPQDEVVEIGIFLLKKDLKTLELTFRWGANKIPIADEVEFSADPDSPTGVAGRVFVSGDAVMVSRTDPLHDHGVRPGVKKSTSVYEGIISLPIIDWDQDGTPLGVIYITTSTVRGVLFGLSQDPILVPQQKSLEVLYAWLHNIALKVLAELKD